MEVLGIIRRMDDFGRIVIPREIRKRFKLEEGDAIEFFTDKNGKIILKKYNPNEKEE